MKIKSITIRDYGPIKDFTFTPDNFEIIFGLNESGKTAIIEALTCVLFKRSPTPLRYGKPENTIVQIEEDEILYTLPAKKKNIELPSGDIANLLYVQASESSIYGSKGEASFWDEIKALLSRVAKGVPLTKLDDKIFEAVELTPKRSDWREDKQRLIQNEEKRRDELGTYLKKIGEIEKKEIVLSNLLEKKETLKNNLKEIDNYKNYKIYHELLNLYNAYREKKIILQEHERYKYEYVTKWQELETRKKSRIKDEKKLKDVIEELKETEEELIELKKKEEIIESEDLKSYLGKTLEQEVREASIIYPILSTVVFAITLILLLLSKIPAYGGIILFVISALPFIFYLYKKKLARASADKNKEGLKKGKKVFPEIRSLAELIEKIDLTKNLTIEKEARLAEKKKLIEHLSREETVGNIEKELSELRSKTGLAELSDLKNKIEKKREFEGDKNKSNGKIFGMLHEKDDKKWERLIKEKKTKQPETEPDLTQEKDIKSEYDKTKEKIDELTKEIGVFKEIQRTKFDITDERSAFIEYHRLDKKLENYELQKKAALIARQIFREMSSELDEFIHDIITGNDSLSEYFKLITERYDEVEVKNKNFLVKQKDGKTFEIEDLSSGAQDQLLLCFRIAALKKIYAQGSFLILDDAFIFADWDRRKRLAKLLKKFIDDGNQVIYLTSDDHTRDLFKDLGAKITTI